MGSRFACQASAAFGLEGLVAEELRSLNMADVCLKTEMYVFPQMLRSCSAAICFFGIVIGYLW